MADFCAGCVEDLFGEGTPPDIKSVDEEHVVAGLCESCGPGWFDHEGHRVEEG